MSSLPTRPLNCFRYPRQDISKANISKAKHFKSKNMLQFGSCAEDLAQYDIHFNSDPDLGNSQAGSIQKIDVLLTHVAVI